MDPAQQVELHALRHQAVLVGGPSAVQCFYRGATVLLTGGTGFLGKHLVHKLFRSCEIKKIYLLLRSKRDKTIHERLQHMLKDPVYNTLREEQPQFADRIVPVGGDVALLGLGLTDEDRNMLTEEVNIIFHVAATIRFDQVLRAATLTNVRGTREVLALANRCANFKKLVHVSSQYIHATRDRIGTELLEQFYPCPVSPEAMIQFAESLEEKRLDDITADLCRGWPNTYTFTKALAENLLRTSAGELPVCIVRPPIVLPAYYEPNPGWLDTTSLASASGVYLGVITGAVNVVRLDVNVHMAMCPVDYVTNAIIAAAWDSSERTSHSDRHIPIYSIRKYLRYGMLSETIHKERHRLVPASAVWKSSWLTIKNKNLYSLSSLFLHFVPAYLLDFFCSILGRKPKHISSFVDVYKKLEKLCNVYDYYTRNEWDFDDTNVRDMIDRMGAADRAIFNCDVNTIDLYEYILVWGIGLRKYIIKDGLRNTDVANRKQKFFSVANYIVLALYGYVPWYICCTIFTIIKKANTRRAVLACTTMGVQK